MDWNHDGEEDWQDAFVTQKLVSDKKHQAPGTAGCLTAALMMLAAVALIAVALFG